MTPVDYNAIATWAALCAAIAAIYAIYIDGKRSRFSQGLDLLEKLNDKFDGERLVSARRKYAKFLLNETKLLKKEREILESAILDHFQDVGNLARKHILDIDLTWSYFGYWLRFYFRLLKDVIKDFQEKSDPSGWEDVVWLFGKFLRKDIKAKVPNLDDPTIWDTEKRDFLIEESTLK